MYFARRNTQFAKPNFHQVGDIPELVLEVTTQKQNQCFLPQVTLELSHVNLIQNLFHDLENILISTTSLQIKSKCLLKSA